MARKIDGGGAVNQGIIKEKADAKARDQFKFPSAKTKNHVGAGKHAGLTVNHAGELHGGVHKPFKKF